ncbi:hypothetical protein PCE1_001057 [Barthelona sp. PCE]
MNTDDLGLSIDIKAAEPTHVETSFSDMDRSAVAKSEQLTTTPVKRAPPRRKKRPGLSPQRRVSERNVNRQVSPKKQIPVQPVQTTPESPSVLKTNYPQLMNKKSIRLIFDNKKDYQNSSDPEMETPLALEAREQLKFDTDIVSALHEFVVNVYHPDPMGRVWRDSYIEVHQNMSRVLLPNISDNERIELAELDWLNDAPQGKSFMMTNEVCMVVFVLADLWTLNIDKEEYIDFLSVLRLKLVYENQGSKDRDAYDVLNA